LARKNTARTRQQELNVEGLAQNINGKRCGVKKWKKAGEINSYFGCDAMYRRP